MSFDYFVAVHRSNWPTAKAVQAALSSLGYPLSLLSAPDEAFSIQKDTFSLPVIFEGKQITLEADIDRASETTDAESLWGYIATCVAEDFTISDGDYVLTLTFRSDSDRIRAGLYLMAAVIIAFDGHGFENQFETHGGAEFAHQLVAEASDAAAFEDP